jgi:MoxR-like ATPase
MNEKLSTTDHSATQRYVNALTERLTQRVFGLEGVVRSLALARIAGGHVLLQGPPGVGKTLLARSFSESIGGVFRRVQGTPDLLPGDMTGVTVFKPDGAFFEFRPGPLFADVVLVDEINRAGPKTQAALLEAMEERHVTMDNESHNLPENFIVIATQNPIDFEGTYPLPESQIDRFLVRLDVVYADRESEAEVLLRYGKTQGAYPSPLEPLHNESAMLHDARAAVDATRIERPLIDYVLDICDATRRSEKVSLGLSTRAARALLLMARVEASAQGFDFVRPDDLQAVVTSVASHRLSLTPEVTFSGQSAEEVVLEIVTSVPVPRIEAAADQIQQDTRSDS